MTWSAFRLDLRRNRSLVVWLASIALVYGGTMALVFPTFRDNTAQLEEYLKLYPKEFLEAFGLEGSLTDPGAFFSTYVGTYLWPIVAAIAGTVAGTRTVAADLDRGFLELILATRMPRLRYLLISIAGQALVMLALAAASVGGVVLVGAFVGAAFDVSRFLLAVPLLFAFGCAVAAVATLVGVVSLSRGVGAGITAGLLIGMYLISAITKLQPDLGWLAPVSAFTYFKPGPVIDQGTVPFGSLAVFAGVALVAWALALGFFRRRDLAA